MIISKNSWHYKLNEQWGSRSIRDKLAYDESLSFCEYFSSTIATTIGVVIAWSIFMAVLAPFVLMFSSFTGIWWDIPKYYEIGMGLLLMTIIIAPIAGILTTLFGPMKVFPKWLPVDKWVGIAVNKTIPVVPKKVNIFVEYVKAKKSKVCPMIEFKGE
jgi:hypothetical protein